MTDYSINDTIYIMFTTRAFSTGVPTVLAGTPVISAYENDSAVQITAGITLGVSHDSVVGMNLITIVATTGNGFEAGKDYNLVITTGTVDSVSVVGEVVGSFSIERAATVADIAALNNVAATDIVSSGAIDTSSGAVSTVTNLTNLPSIPTNWLTAAGIAASALDGKGDWNIGKTGYALSAAGIDAIWDEDQSGHTIAGTFGKFLDVEVSSVSGGGGLTQQDVRDAMKLAPTSGAPAAGSVDLHLDDIIVDTGTDIPTSISNLNDVAATDIVSAGAITTLSGAVVNVDTVDTCTTNTDMRGTNGANTVAPDNASIAAILTDTADMQPKLGTPATTISGDLLAIDNFVDGLESTIGVAGAGLTDLGGMSTGMKAEVNAEADTALADYDPPTNAEMEARTPTAAQLAYIVANAATGLPVTFTTAGGSTTAAVLNQVDGAPASGTDDQYKSRLLVFTSGTLKGVVTDIPAYNGTTKVATITAIPFAPESTHTARLI